MQAAEILFKTIFIKNFIKPGLSVADMEVKKCISTKRRIDNDPGAVNFKCPNCGNYEITRSTFARENAIKYKCPACEFTGPN